MANAQSNYRAWMEQNLLEIVTELQITELQRKILIRRWLDQLIFFEGAAGKAKKSYYFFRITAIIGGILVPLVASLQLPDVGRWSLGIILTSIIGSVVAAVGSLEAFLKTGDRMRQYRQSAEFMKIEGWSFFSLTGEYGAFNTHAEAYETFAGRVEDIVRLDVRSFVSKLAEKKPGQSEDETGVVGMDEGHAP